MRNCNRSKKRPDRGLGATVITMCLDFQRFEKNWIFRKTSIDVHANTWKRGVYMRAAKKQKTTRELICRHDGRLLRVCWENSDKSVVGCSVWKSNGHLRRIRQSRKWVLKQKPKNNKKLKTRNNAITEQPMLDARDSDASVSL